MIIDLIRAGESKVVEFKSEMPQGNQLAQTVCAFANRAGGYLFIGISDSGEVNGLSSERVTEYQEKIPNIIYDSVFPMLIPEIYTVNLSGKLVLVVQIFPGSNIPYYIKSKGKTDGTYVRVGRTNKRADLEMIKALERQKLNKSYDEDLFDVLDVEDENHLITVLEKALSSDVTKEKLINLKLVERVSDVEYLTNAGAIVVGKLSNSSVKCARFPGESIVDFMDRKSISGDTFSMIREVMLFFRNHLMNTSVIKGQGLQRKDTLEIPEEVLREGIVNAILHRDYSILGADIKVAIFDSKIEITSPGGLPKSLTVEDIYSGRSEIRNRALANLLMKAGYVEQWGSGIPRIMEMCQEVGLRSPEIEEKGLFVVLRIFRQEKGAGYASYAAKKNEKERSKGEEIAESLKQIYDMLVEDNEITVREVAEKTFMTEASAQRRLKTLQDKGLIERIGSKKTGHWVVKDKQ